jgi:hypothetical protein
MFPFPVAVANYTADAACVVTVGKVTNITALLKAEATPEELKQILIFSGVLYCMAVYVNTPLETAAPEPGVDVKVPEPAVPPQLWFESTTVLVTVDELSVVTVLPNWS